MSSAIYTQFLSFKPIYKNEIFLSLQQTLDIVHKAYLVPNAIKRTAHKYNIDPNEIRRWKNALPGLDEEDGWHQLACVVQKVDRSKGRRGETSLTTKQDRGMQG